MSDNLKFDYVKAKNLSNLMKEYKRSVDEMANVLKSEVTGMGEWWVGDSYTSFKRRFESSGSAKVFLEELSEELLKTGNWLANVNDSKKDYERSTAKYFR